MMGEGSLLGLGKSDWEEENEGEESAREIPHGGPPWGECAERSKVIIGVQCVTGKPITPQCP